jgi:DNA-binding transcriptional LysR family regulator
MDRLAAMHTFVRVAEAGSFTAVADQMNVARSAVTRQIAALETHLGVKLISRSTRRLSLTQDGIAYLARCRAILDQVNAAEAELAEGQRGARGLIRATLPMSFGLKHVLPLVAEFTAQHPEVAVDLDFSDRRVDLIEEGFDFGIRITGTLPESQVARRICACRFAVVAAPTYLKAHGTPRHPRELRQHECLVYSLATRSGWRFEIDGEIQNIEVAGRFSADSGDAIHRAALSGMGIAYQPTFIVAEALRDGQLQRLFPDIALPTLAIYVVYPGNRFVPQRVRQFADFLVSRLGGADPYWDAACG